VIIGKDSDGHMVLLDDEAQALFEVTSVTEQLMDEKSVNLELFSQFTSVKALSKDRFSVEKGLLWGLADERLNILLMPIYDWIHPFVEGIAIVERGGKWGYIDTNGKIIVEPKYHYARSFSEGMAAVELNGCWGFINTHGEEVVKPMYDTVIGFNNGEATVQVTKKWLTINKEGKIKSPGI